MTQPLTGNICIPMSYALIGRTRNNINATLPTDVNVQGNYTCSGVHYQLSVMFMIIILILFNF